MIFSEKEANWYKFSPQLKVGDIFEARVGSVEDYGAFVHLRFEDGIYLFHRLFVLLLFAILDVISQSSSESIQVCITSQDLCMFQKCRGI